jgi:hypothetical protein
MRRAVAVPPKNEAARRKAFSHPQQTWHTVPMIANRPEPPVWSATAPLARALRRDTAACAKFKATQGIRTLDLPITNRLLYHLS